MTVASAPGKCILFGEHAVLYGSPAVAVAIDARVRVEVAEAESGPRVDGSLIEPGRHPHVRALLSAFDLPEDAPVDVRIESALFPAAGLGSSAALASAGAAALMAHLRGGVSSPSPLRTADLQAIAMIGHEAEAAAQGGRASPTDTATATHGGCVLVDALPNDDLPLLQTRTLATPDGERSWSVHSVPLPATLDDVSLVIGWTGVHASTAELVGKVAHLIERDPSKLSEMDRIAQVARMGVEALRGGLADGVGAAMEMCQVLLASLGVSSPDLDRLIDAARPHSLGAKLTGAGGGGCMIALTRDPRRCSEAIEMAGGRTLTSRLGAPGVRIEP